ncbi:ligase-associated DNA damage response endonuclease PdeM [Paracoccus sp. MC1854]|uniref:ligase-associated DNA damage response endonuclease PdeM n=1 Tax=Paracoccus sp. MC1854 TaxID=2760306 RepID=UPI0016045CF0|nr:ligase-associated DNA damage response endonuclease PdeM [Paracoccus sp. MC1854]MBB1491541.1 ligase-associated DNA damage response endonuclease PdeM [Paracoccus sp. MC1854]
MTGFAFTWHGLQLEARCSGALWWPEERWLVVADLHLGKSERMARRGGALLPPYEGIETLRRLEAEAEALDPAVIVSLGDGFDDDAAAEGLNPAVEKAVAALGQGRRLLWIAGNHDPKTGGEALKMGRATLRHEPQGDGPDISGHFHPVVRLAGARRRALLVGPSHMILPAFGAYTGGLDAGSRVITRWVPQGFAVACLHKALPVPLRAA